MSQDNQAKCPISGDDVVLRESTGDFREYDCPTCGVFRISRTALQLAGEQDQALLREALDIAIRNAAPGELPMISNLSG